MRLALIAAVAALALPVPALAQDNDARRMAEELKDPVRQEQMAATAEAMAGAMLDLPVGPLLRAAATMAGQDPGYVDPDTRIGDVVGPDAADAPRAIAAHLPVMMGAVAEMSDALQDMLPRLAEIGARAREDMARRR